MQSAALEFRVLEYSPTIAVFVVSLAVDNTIEGAAELELDAHASGVASHVQSSNVDVRVCAMVVIVVVLLVVIFVRALLLQHARGNLQRAGRFRVVVSLLACCSQLGQLIHILDQSVHFFLES